MTRTINPIAVFSLLFFCGIVFFISCENKETVTFKLPGVFSDNMVLQREKPVPVWGTSQPGEKIQVEFRDQIKTTIVSNDGQWKVILDAMPAGGPFSLIIKGKNTVTFQNVMVGEVWLCSGQSNMEMPVNGSWARVNNYQEVIDNASYKNIRLLTVKKTASTIPLKDVKTSGWMECSPRTIGEFSAVAYFFGKDIHLNHDIPVGLIHSSWGGTIAEAWTSASSLKRLDDFNESVKHIEESPVDKEVLHEQYRKEYAEWELKIRQKDAGMSQTDTVWKKMDLDISGWKEVKLPSVWEETVLPGFDGIVYFRKSIQLSTDYTGQDATLNIGPCDDIDWTWFNGQLVGEGNVWDEPRHYHIPADLIREGENLIVVRVQDNQGGGGIWGKAKDFSLVSKNGQQIPLAGKWLYNVGADLVDLPDQPKSPDDPNRPTVLYNAMLHPLIPFAIRGAIWYQGESNTGRAYQYRELFKTMISDWRDKWGIGDFPFYFVQLANFMKRQEQPVESEWAELREAQMMALQLPNTGMAVTIDIGETGDIHPRNKQDVGKRLALWARNKVYGEQIAYSGPLYSNFKKSGQNMEIYFKFADSGLSTSDGKSLKGFSIAGKDRKFYWADAKIKGDKVIISHPQVRNPIAVRYAWQDNPECNLTNASGLPASPFRTDQLPGLTVGRK